MIKKYRKLPVEIEAVQYTFNNNMEKDLIQDEIANFMDENICICGDKIEMETLEGTMVASIGDYIIKGINGEFYPCKPDIFEKTYEEVK